MESQNMLVVVEGEAYDTRGESEYCPAAVVTDETGWWVEDWTRREERASQRGHWWTLSCNRGAKSNRRGQKTEEPKF